MATTFDLAVTITLEHEEGKFATRLEMEAALIDLLETGLDGSSIHGLGADGSTSYEITEINVDVQ